MLSSSSNTANIMGTTTANLLNEFCVDGMEGRGDELANAAESFLHLKSKEENLGLSVWPHNAVEDQTIKKCVSCPPGSTLPCTCSSSTSDAGFMVEELTFNNYEKSKLSTVGSFGKTELMESRKGQWQNLYGLAGGSGKDTLSKETFTSAAEFQGQKLPFPVQPNQNRVSEFSVTRNKNVALEHVLPCKENQAKPFKTSSFSRFFVKNALMDKSPACRNRETCDGIGPTEMGQNEGKEVCATNSFVNYRPKDDSVHGVSSIVPITSHEGKNLREWLSSGSSKVNKRDRLYIFSQIVKLVGMAHAQHLALQEIRPSCFELLSSNRVKYIGSLGTRDTIQNAASLSTPDMHLSRKRSLEHNNSYNNIGSKFRKLGDNSKVALNNTPYQSASSSSAHKTAGPKSRNIDFQLEKKWYTSPEELNGSGSTLSSNIYNLGILLFELLCCFQSLEVHAAAMSDLRHRILLPTFLSENPLEAGFCLWLLHPEPSSRPTTREILQSEILCGSQESSAKDQVQPPVDEDGAESDFLLHFLTTLKDEKLKKASKLVEDIKCLETDLEEVSKRHVSRTGETLDLLDKKMSGPAEVGLLRSCFLLNKNESTLTRNISQIESVYYAMRSQIQLGDTNTMSRSDLDVIRNRDRFSTMQVENKEAFPDKIPTDRLGSLFDGLCKYARYNKIEQRAVLRNGDLLNSANVICSLSFDRDEDYFATAGVSKKIKIFEFDALLNDSVDIHYPVIEMTNKSKLSCVCWNSYIKNYLASTDYDGDVQLWDASTGQVFSQYMEHKKRAWSADFSQVDPKKLASGSDDGLVKLWSIDEPKSIDTIRNIANVCCVQFSAHSTNFLTFGSADYKTYCFDLRNTKVPWCTLSGHGKAVSYVKFLDSETLVTASTDNTIKLWDLNKTSSTGLSPAACSITFRGHTNEKNFVGLSVSDGYIACGSETNEVYAYHRSLPMPITSYKFGSIDPISGQETGDDNGQFVSSVCWRGKSNMVVTANSTGSIKLLQLV